MPPKKKILFIVNPISGTKKKIPIEQLVNIHLDKNIFDSKVYFTTSRGDAIVQSKKAAEDGFDIVVAVGGDGTINEVAQGLLGSNASLAVIPRGSGNGFANYFKIPHNPVGALNVINNLSAKRIDVGKLNGKLFLSVAGLGFDARVSTAFDAFSKRGLLSYMYISLREYFKFRPKTYTIEADGLRIETKAFLLTAANSSQYGNNAFIAPNALIDDGLLDLVIIKPTDIFNSLLITLRMFNGTLHKSKFCQVVRIKEVKIFHRDYEAQVDGEPIQVDKETIIKIFPAALNVIA